jgi:hypothetical protein
MGKRVFGKGEIMGAEVCGSELKKSRRSEVLWKDPNLMTKEV